MLTQLPPPLLLSYRGFKLTACVSMKDYYHVLGLEKTCTAKEIRSKYVELCKLFHPDTVTSGDAHELDEKKKKFQEVQEAYNTLSKESDRRMYDSQQSAYADFGESARWRRRPYYQAPQYQDPYERAREFHRNRRKQEGSEDTDGWTWGDYWKEDGFGKQDQREQARQERDSRYYETKRQQFEREREEYREWARERGPAAANGVFSKFSIVIFCVTLVMLSSLLSGSAFFFRMNDEKYLQERARIMAAAERRRRGRQYNMSDPEDRRHFQMVADEYARRYR